MLRTGEIEGSRRSKTALGARDQVVLAWIEGGDPITVWLTQPLFYFEPPMIVVRRHW